MPFFEPKDPRNEMINTTARFPRWMLEELAAVAMLETQRGSGSEWTSREEVSRDDVMRTACKVFLTAYKAERGPLPAVPPAAKAPAKKKTPAAKKGRGT